jgi:hypothetical protein
MRRRPTKASSDTAGNLINPPPGPRSGPANAWSSGFTAAGILTVAQLWNATPFQLRRVWGGVNGVLFHQMLHGVGEEALASRRCTPRSMRAPSNQLYAEQRWATGTSAPGGGWRFRECGTASSGPD